MDENQEKKVDTEELKTETSNAVNQVKDTIKKVDIKKDSIETKGFIVDMFKNPLEKIQEIVTKDTGKFLTYAIIIIAVWTIAELLVECFSLGNIWGYMHIGSSILSIIKIAITPILSILAMTFIVFIMNTKNKKSLTTVVTAITAAKIPVVIASVLSILRILSSQIGIITSPITKLCSVVSIILMYFATKSIFGIDKNSDFIKKFVMIEAIYYVVYIVLTFLGIYI